MSILTDTRRDLLEGEYEGTRDAEYNARKRLRDTSRENIEDLIEIAESDEIDNEEIFQPEAIGRLLRAIIGEIDTPIYERENPSEEMIEHDYERQMTKAIRRVAQEYDDDLSFSEPAHLRRSGDGGGVK